MAGRSLTEEAMLAGLHDIRLPESAPGGLPAELLAAVGVGIFGALFVGALAMAVTRRVPRAQTGRKTTDGEIDEGTENARRRALIRQLKRDRPDRYAALAGDLYRKGAMPETAALEAMVAGR